MPFMATTLKSIVRFTVPVAPLGGVSTTTHGLMVNDQGVIPDLIFLSTAGFTATATTANITVTNNGDLAATVDAYCIRWHMWAVLVPDPFVCSPGLAGSAAMPDPYTPIDGTWNVIGSIDTTVNVSGASLTATGLTQGSVVFAGAGGLLSQDNANLFYADGTNRLGIGTATPATSLNVRVNAIGVTSTTGLLVNNETVSALGAQQWAPAIELDGRGWGVVPGVDCLVQWKMEVRPVQGAGAVPTSIIAWTEQTAGGGWTDHLWYDTTAPGVFNVASDILLASTAGASNIRFAASTAGAGLCTFRVDAQAATLDADGLEIVGANGGAGTTAGGPITIQAGGGGVGAGGVAGGGGAGLVFNAGGGGTNMTGTPGAGGGIGLQAGSGGLSAGPKAAGGDVSLVAGMSSNVIMAPAQIYIYASNAAATTGGNLEMRAGDGTATGGNALITLSGGATAGYLSILNSAATVDIFRASQIAAASATPDVVIKPSSTVKTGSPVLRVENDTTHAAGATANPGFELYNATAADAGHVTQYSPLFVITGHAYDAGVVGDVLEQYAWGVEPVGGGPPSRALLKIASAHNGAAWSPELTLDYRGIFTSTTGGSAAVPAYGLLSDPNTGIYGLGGDILGISAGGVLREQIGVGYVGYSPQDNAAVEPDRPVRTFYYNKSVNDDAVITCPPFTTHCWGRVLCHTDAATRADFVVTSAGVVTLITFAGSVVAGADTDTNLCIGTASPQEPLQIKNRLGGPFVITVILWYD